MPSVFLSHSSKDKPFVRELAAELSRGGEIEVWLDEREIAPGDNIVGRIGAGLENADFVLLILSPDSVESKWVKEEWTDAFWQQTNERHTRLIGVLYRDCRIPALLRNKKYFDLRTNHPEGFRQIRTYLLTERPAPPPRVNYLPVRPPLFIGREPELSALRDRLRQPGAVAPVSGIGGKGKTTLALEFAHRYQTDFESVYWLPCESSSLVAISAELSRQIGLKVEGDVNEVVRELKRVCAGRRCLLVLDNVESEVPGELIPGGLASVLVTTRQTNLQFLRFHASVPLPVFREAECFDLFRRGLGDGEITRHEADCRALFNRIGYLPIGVAVSAALIREDVRYTIPGLARDLPGDVTELIRTAVEALTPEPRRLLAAMAACAPEGFFFDLASEVAGMIEPASLEALQQLVSRSLVDEIDRTDRRYALHAMVREVADGRPFAQAHAEAVRGRFKDWEVNWRRCEQESADFQIAFEWAVANAADSWAESLAYSGYSLMRRVGRMAEAFEICDRMRQVEDARGNRANLQAWLGNQALILQAWGRLEEALALHRKKEAICLELGNKSSLGYCYWSWGLLERDFRNHEAELDKLSRALALFTELGMPRQREAVAAELAKARAAGAD